MSASACQRCPAPRRVHAPAAAIAARAARRRCFPSGAAAAAGAGGTPARRGTAPEGPDAGASEAEPRRACGRGRGAGAAHERAEERRRCVQRARRTNAGRRPTSPTGKSANRAPLPGRCDVCTSSACLRLRLALHVGASRRRAGRRGRACPRVASARAQQPPRGVRARRWAQRRRRARRGGGGRPHAAGEADRQAGEQKPLCESSLGLADAPRRCCTA